MWVYTRSREGFSNVTQDKFQDNQYEKQLLKIGEPKVGLAPSGEGRGWYDPYSMYNMFEQKQFPGTKTYIITNRSYLLVCLPPSAPCVLSASSTVHC